MDDRWTWIGLGLGLGLKKWQTFGCIDQNPAIAAAVFLSSILKVWINTYKHAVNRFLAIVGQGEISLIECMVASILRVSCGPFVGKVWARCWWSSRDSLVK
ncbi:MAG: hypothetical protein EA001_03565 [Oscillatoriales cyanobacterium]|nr:MAG: hypothetical protein EA001_03565 [Oscillatoriales cyanobacterium]